MPKLKNLYELTSGQKWTILRFEHLPKLAHPVQRVYRLNEDFDFPALIDSVNFLALTHPSLRMRIIKNQTTWMQYFPIQFPSIKRTKVKGPFNLYRSNYANLIIENDSRNVINLLK